jgi:hypothetical protein
MGSYNTATGSGSLLSNASGTQNTANGGSALSANTTGNYNTVSGFQALYSNTVGGQNTASGVNALYHSNATGNTAFGYAALQKNTSGNHNVALGWAAGLAVTTGSNNIDIGNPGESTDGVAADSGVIRIGTQSPTALQTNTYIAGIYDNSSVSGLAVVIDSNGQLGTVSSSERFKSDIAPMGSNTDKLQQLRPVSFHYKADSQGTLRYGLIAEEVAEVYPELVVRDKNGRIDGVRYDELAPMLLNEVQKQQRINAAQADQNTAQAAKIASLEQQLAGIQASLVKLQPKDQLVAQR